MLEDLESSVLISLKAKRRKEGDFYSGWWGDEILGFELGSKLHCLERATINKETVEETKIYTEEALRNIFQDFKVSCYQAKDTIKTKVEVQGVEINA